MAPRGVSVLKFVGTVSLGLLTGLSYTLSTLTVPTLLTLPSADTAARAFHSLASTAKRQLSILASVSGSAFLLAFVLSPRPYRHPYLLYTSLLVFGSRLAASETLAPYLFAPPPRVTSSKISGTKKTQNTRARMEASYEVVGSSDSHSDGAGSDDLDREEDAQTRQMNGEEVRGEVEHFLKKQAVQTAVAGLGFLMSVIGIWGDGALQVYQSETFVIEV